MERIILTAFCFPIIQAQATNYIGTRNSFIEQTNPLIHPSFHIEANGQSEFPQQHTKYHGYGYETEDARGARARVVFITGATQSEVKTLLPNIRIFPNIPQKPPRTEYIEDVSKTPASDSIDLNAFTDSQPIYIKPYQNLYSAPIIFPSTTQQVVTPQQSFFLTQKTHFGRNLHASANSTKSTPRYVTVAPKHELQQNNETKTESFFFKNNTNNNNETSGVKIITDSPNEIIEAKTLETNIPTNISEKVLDKESTNTSKPTSESLEEATTLQAIATNETSQEVLDVTQTTETLEEVSSTNEKLEVTTIVENILNLQNSENSSVNNESFQTSSTETSTTVLPEVIVD